MFVSPLSTLGRIVCQNSIRQNRQSRTSQALLAAACQTLRVAAMESLETRTLLSSVVLGPQLTYGIPGAPASIAAADLTGDGFKDIITANSNGTVSVLMNSGDGELSTATSISDGLSKSTGAYVTVAAGDFNGDGKTGEQNGTSLISPFRVPASSRATRRRGAMGRMGWSTRCIRPSCWWPRGHLRLGLRRVGRAGATIRPMYL